MNRLGFTGLRGLDGVGGRFTEELEEESSRIFHIYGTTRFTNECFIMCIEAIKASKIV